MRRRLLRADATPKGDDDAHSLGHSPLFSVDKGVPLYMRRVQVQDRRPVQLPVRQLLLPSVNP